MKFLLRHREFARLWLASTISQVGTHVTLIVLPLIALTQLKATVFQVSALGIAEYLPFILVGLQAGAILDERERKPIMLLCDIVRAAALACIPIAWGFGVLRLWMMYVVVFIVGIGTVFFDVAAQSMTPSIVAVEELGEAGQATAAAESVARTAGPGIGGLILSVLSAPVAVVIDVASYLVSFWLLLKVRPRPIERPDDGTVRPRLRTQIGEGLTFLRHHRTLRPILFALAVSNFASFVQQAVLITFMVRTLNYSPKVIGLIFMVGNIGVMVGAAQSVKVMRVLRLGRALWIMSFISGVGCMLASLASGRLSVPILVVSWFLIMSASTVGNVGQLSYRQAATPSHLLGRMNASFRFFLLGMIPVGFLVGGVLGTRIGLRETMFVAGVFTMIPFVVMLYSPVADLVSLADAAPSRGGPASE